MSSLHQPLPLNHPPPRQQISQPPLKKPRLNAKPKLTPHQITQPTVIQSALRIGRQARENPPHSGKAHHRALDSLLKQMETWANQLAPQYTLAEFVVAAQSIAGNRELRPMLAEFRLAELRDVNAENDHDNDASGPTQSVRDADRVVQADVGPVDANVGPVDADVGPVDADVAPDDDDWDELDLVPDEAVEIRPIRKNQPTSSDAIINQDDNKHSLSADIEAKIEQNRRAAIERRKAVVARLRADKEAEEKQSTQHVDASHEKSTRNPVDTPEQEKGNPKLRTATLSNSSPSPFEKGKQSSQKLNPSDDQLSSESVKTVLKEHDHNAKSEQAKDATSKADNGKAIQTDASNTLALPDHASQKHGEADERREKEDSHQLHLSSTEGTQNAIPETNANQAIEKSDTASPKEDSVDQDVDTEILAEFEDGDDA